MRKMIALASLMVALLMPSSGWAWDRIGHMLVAQIAYEQLRPEVKKRVEELTQVIDTGFPKTNFVRAAVWPDWIRADGVSAFDDWHYIDMPYSPDKLLTRHAHKHNIVWAIQQSSSVIQNKRAREFEKGFFLRFLTHLVGDVHQPLHCINRYSKQHPYGDRGGNLYTINSDLAPNLHSLWDKGLGLFGEDMHTLAHQIQQKYPKTAFIQELADDNPQDWAQEGYQLGREFVYTIPENSMVDDVYLAEGREIVERRIALAGYRLAQILNQLEI